MRRRDTAHSFSQTKDALKSFGVRDEEDDEGTTHFFNHAGLVPPPSPPSIYLLIHLCGNLGVRNTGFYSVVNTQHLSLASCYMYIYEKICMG